MYLCCFDCILNIITLISILLLSQIIIICQCFSLENFELLNMTTLLIVQYSHTSYYIKIVGYCHSYN